MTRNILVTKDYNKHMQEINIDKKSTFSVQDNKQTLESTLLEYKLGWREDGCSIVDTTSVLQKVASSVAGTKNMYVLYFIS